MEEEGRREGEEREREKLRGEGGSIKVTYSTDEACIVPAVAQGLQEPIPGINLKVTAVAFGAEHLLVVCGEKGGARTGERRKQQKRVLIVLDVR